MLASGVEEAEILDDYPSLTPEDILACLRYTADLAEEEMTPLAMEPAGI
jgi:uncharacterized protein (DUF433 family)